MIIESLNNKKEENPIYKNPAMKVNDDVGIAIYHAEKSETDKIRLNKLISPYLASGFHHDKVSIIEATFHDHGGILVFEMSDYFMPSDDEFHLSSILAEVCVLHAGVIYAHIDTGSAIKNREVYLRSSKMNYKKPIREKRFSFEFTVINKVIKGAMKSYQATLNFNDGCFTGEYQWIIPLNTVNG
jgi:hypothetical protein